MELNLRVTAVFLVVTFLCGYAWFRSWFVALCGAIVLMAFLEHPDMPRGMLGIQGLNFWNILFLNVFLAWFVQRSRDGHKVDLPYSLKVAFGLYLVVIVVSFLRLVLYPSPYMVEVSVSEMTNNYLTNPLKFLIPCFLLYEGCRTRERVVWALGCVMLVNFLLAVQTIKYMGIDFNFGGEALQRRALRVISRDIGFHRVDMSMILAGASWAMLAFSRLFDSKLIRMALWGAAGVIVLGQSMTAGRAGYITWGIIGLFLCVVRWRVFLPLVPIGAAAVLILVPGVRDRVFEGFGSTEGPIHIDADQSEMTAGRSDIWPYVVDEIKEAPVIGYGRQAMRTTGLAHLARVELGDVFGHPHNAYLELLLDNGVVGFLCVMLLYFLVWRKSLSLFCDREDRLYEAVGGASLALLMALLVAALGAQTFYPREGTVMMWAVVGIAMRVWFHREELYEQDEENLEDEEWEGGDLVEEEQYPQLDGPRRWVEPDAH